MKWRPGVSTPGRSLSVVRSRSRSRQGRCFVRESVVVIHGGCGTVPDEYHAAAVLGVHAAARAAQKILGDGGSCEDAAVGAVRVLEDDPVFNAGRGSCMTAAGTFEHDAGLMRSRDLR